LKKNYVLKTVSRKKQVYETAFVQTR